MTNIAQILVAAGKGARFSGNLPKQYIDIGGKTLLRHTLEACQKALPETDSFVIVINPDDAELAKAALAGFDMPFELINGGATRSQSVRAGMMALKSVQPDYVFIHDAARPFVSADLYVAALDALQSAPHPPSAAAPVLPIADAVKLFDNKQLGEDVDRAVLRRIQTPQGFDYMAMLPLYEALDVDADFSDDIALAQKAGLSVAAFPGDPANIKITYPEDIKTFSGMTETQYYIATGSGFDVHRTMPGNHVWLCGVKIDAPFSLKGHSDADAGLHALTDAILGALCLGDIGEHFPPNDDRWKGASSDQFLAHAAGLAGERGGRIEHVDVTLICEQPKIGPHKTAMRARMAEILALPASRISVKATTSERLGFTGRGEGIAAQATATLRLKEE